MITNMGRPLEMVHIYPFSLNAHTGETSTETFWCTLTTFWLSKDIDAWTKAVMGKKKTESPSNMITLSLTVHKLWMGCFFALKLIA